MSISSDINYRSSYDYRGQPSNNEIKQYSSAIYSKSISPYLNEKPASLSNQGANCYLNAGFQAISACSEFIKEMEQLLTVSPSCEKLKTFNELMRELQNPETNLEISKNKIFQNWNKSGQQDSLELLTHVFNEIYDEIKTQNGIPKNNLNEGLKLNLPMRIIFENKITCCMKSKVHTRIQCDFAFHIPICKNRDSNPIKLKDLIDIFFNKEKIEDYNCEEDNCSGTEASKQTKLDSPFPNTICIHLQRLFWDNEKMHKIEEKVEFEEEIIMKQSFFNDCTTDKKYYLKSVIVHHGDASFGHYICYKLFKNNWFYTSDSFIMKDNIKGILDCQAYILFYENVKDIQDTNESNIVSQIDINKTSEIDITHKSSQNNSILTKRSSESNRLDSRNLIDKSPEIQTFELSQFESILIEALSSCQTFVYELKKNCQKNITDKNQKIIDLILKQNSPFNYKSYPNVNINFDCNDLKRTLISIFNNGLHTNFNMETDQERLVEKYPFELSFQYKIRCPCSARIEHSVSEVVLILENYFYDLQKALVKFFEDEKFIKFDRKHNSCFYSCGYGNIKLKSIPKIICIYNKRDSFKLDSIKEIKIKKNYFSSYIDNGDYKYYLKSVLCNSRNGYECYRLYGDEWFHIANNKINKIDSDSCIRCKVMFFEQSLESGDVHCSTYTNNKISRNQNSEIYSNDLSNRENNTWKQLDINPKESNRINRIMSDDMYYLKIVLHALSSCKSFSKKVGEIISCNAEDHYYLSSTEMKSIDEQIENINLLEDIVNKLNFHLEMNLFQLLSKLLSYILKKWPQNPFLITKINTVKCSNCFSVLTTYEDKKMSFDIPVNKTYENIYLENYIEKTFKTQHLDGISCTRNECSMKINEIISALCDPIPQIICFHIENIIWDGERNKFMNADVKFHESLTLQTGTFGNKLIHNNKKIIYHLKSILISNNYCDEYICYKKVNLNWYKISRSSICKISVYEVMKCKPYILFYERFD